MSRTDCLFVLFFVVSTCLSRADVDLARNGKAVADIVVSKNAVPSVKTAANELKRHLSKISGAEFPIVDAPSKQYENHVYVGDSEYTKKLGIKLDDIKHDGYKIIANDNYVVIAGNEIDNYSKWLGTMKDTSRKRQEEWAKITGTNCRRPTFHDYREFNKDCGFDLQDGTGALYGVYALLEQLGWMWCMPDKEIGIVYPQLKDISIEDQVIKVEPEFPIRIFTDVAGGTYTHEFLWYKSLGTGTSFVMPVYHAIGRLTNYHGHQNDQPKEYFGTVDGKISYTSPKLSSEKLREDFVKYLELVDQVFPGIDYAGLGQPDGWIGMDDADRTAGWDMLKTRGESGRYSNYTWNFNMDIRRRYMKKHPDKKFTVYAYSRTNQVPTNIDEVPGNVVVSYTQTLSNLPVAPDIIKRRDEWQKLMKNPKEQLFIHEYYMKHAHYRNFPPIPVIFTKALKNSFGKLYDKSIGGLVEVGWTSGPERAKEQRGTALPGINHLMLMLHAKLCWNRDLDVDDFIDDYCGKYFGPAKKEMKEFYQFAENVWMRPESRQITKDGGFLKKADVVKYFDILDRAKQKAGDTIYGKRVDYIADEMKPLKKLHDKLMRNGPYIRCFPPRNKSNDVAIDGDLNEPFWKDLPGNAHWLTDMVTGSRPLHLETMAAFRWLPDNSALVVTVSCYEPKMDKIRAKCANRDSKEILKDDFVEIRLETPAGFKPRVVVNPNGVVLDECVTDNIADLPHFYTVKDVAVKKYTDRWVVEARIPAKELHAGKPTKYYPWGVNVFRQRLAGNEPEYYMLSPSGTTLDDERCMGNLYMRK